MAVKIVLALRQKDGVSAERLLKVWREERGPHVASLQTRINLVKYIQVHRQKGALDDGLRSSRKDLMRQEEPPFDLVEELVFDGTLDDFANNYHSETTAWSAFRQSCAEYLDYSRSYIFMVEERPFVSPGSPDLIMASESNHIFKAVAFTIAAGGAKGVEYWTRCHSATTQRWAPSLGLDKYVQNIPYHPDFLDQLQKDFGTAKPPYDICAIMWFNERKQVGQAYATALEAIREDEDSGFMPPNSMATFAGKEHIFVDRYRTS